MIIRQICIQNFRSIKNLSWLPSSNVNCLIGRGDAGKSSVLSAIDLLFSKNWNVQVLDTDFYNCHIEEPIEITATITNFHEDLCSMAKFGNDTRGWKEETCEVIDEPDDNSELALTIRVTVDKTLEPEWLIVNDRLPDGKPIKGSDREKLGVLKFDASKAGQFGWGRGSLLSRLAPPNSEVNEVILKANRLARSTADFSEADELNAMSGALSQELKNIGVALNDELTPKLSVKQRFGLSSGIEVFDGDIPLSQAGTGSQVLSIFALQHSVQTNIKVLLVDELEYGLEPYRIRHLIRYIQRRSDGACNQVFMTTHSPSAINCLSEKCIHIVKKDGDTTLITQLQRNHRELVKLCPEGLLSKKVIVCEGTTEVAICHELEALWESTENSPVAANGASFVNGNGGKSASNCTAKFIELNYQSAMFVDSDMANNEQHILGLGGQVFQWEAGYCTEQQVVKNISFERLKNLLQIAGENNGSIDALYSQIASSLGVNSQLVDASLEVDGKTQDDLRDAIGLVAHKKGWFKSYEKGLLLGEIIVEHIQEGRDDYLTREVRKIKDWIYGNAQAVR